MNAEEWLKKNCKPDDWDRIADDNLNDSLWTNNVIEYMEQYANYKCKKD